MPYMGAFDLKDADIRRGSATGDGSTVAYAIGWIPPSEQSMFITINGVMQQDAAYTISSSTLTFAAAPALADDIEWRGIQSSGTVVTPGDGTVGESKLADEAVVTAKIADDAVTSAKMGDSAFQANRNYIRNGQFDIWQRGTTITNGSNLAMGYSADGWRDEGYAWTGNVTRQTFTNAQTVVPDNPTYFLRWIVTANPSGFNALVQRIENYPVNRLSGKTIVVSFWIRSVSGTLADGVIMGYGKNTLDGSGTDNLGAITTSWQKITYSGTLGTITTTSWTTGLTTNAGTTFSSGVDIANYQVEIGDTATPFEQKTYGQELEVSQRYYREIAGYTGVGRNSPATIRVSSPISPEMRATPSVTLGGSNNFQDGDGTAIVGDGLSNLSSTSSAYAGIFTVSGTAPQAHRPYIHAASGGGTSKLSAEL